MPAVAGPSICMMNALLMRPHLHQAAFKGTDYDFLPALHLQLLYSHWLLCALHCFKFKWIRFQEAGGLYVSNKHRSGNSIVMFIGIIVQTI